MNNMGAVAKNFLYMEESFKRSQLIKRTCINPLSPNGDQHQFSPNNVHT